MEDYDNAELPQDEYEEQLKEAVETFNAENGTDHNPARMLRLYKGWKHYKYNNLKVR